MGWGTVGETIICEEMEAYPFPGAILVQNIELKGFAVGVLRVPNVFRYAVDKADHVMFPNGVSPHHITYISYSSANQSPT
jgi:hypothetical protein